MVPEGSLPPPQVPATCPYPEPDQSSPCPPPPGPTSWRSILILFSHLRLGLPSALTTTTTTTITINTTINNNNNNNNTDYAQDSSFNKPGQQFSRHFTISPIFSFHIVLSTPLRPTGPSASVSSALKHNGRLFKRPLNETLERLT